MKKILTTALSLMCLCAIHAQKDIAVNSFKKVIISPHIEAIFIEGDEEKVRIEESQVSEDKINIEVEGRTLRVYLDGAKTATKSERVKNDHWKGKRPIYQGKMLTVTITYSVMESLSIRGEQEAQLKSPIDQEEFHLSIYGESEVFLEALRADEFTVAIYGESYLEVKDGEVAYQRYRTYGESEVNALGVQNKRAKITAYGESEFSVNVSERLRVTSFGEARIKYEGNPDVSKGIVLGETKIRKIG